jgi:hypothetical protein
MQYARHRLSTSQQLPEQRKECEMPCDLILQRMKEEQRQREEAKRRRAIADIEEALASGSARLVKQPNGKMMIVGVPLPDGMKDICVLAKLQERNSAGFQRATQMANAQAMNFVGMHNALHQGGGGHGHGH